MEKQISFVVDITKIIVAVGALCFGVWLAERTPIVESKPAQPVIEKETPKRPLFPIRLRGELDGLANHPKISLGDVHPPDGSGVQVAYPLAQDKRNIGSRVDGQGMCVTTSAEMGAIWAGLDQLRGFRDWCAREPGGCGPKKFDDQLKRFCKEKKIDVPNYLFYLGRDAEILKLVLKTGRMPACSYAGRDGVQYRTGIAHVNNLIHFKNNLAGVYDNNYSPTNRIWMDFDSYLDRWTDGGLGWAIVWLDPPPPPRIQR